MAPSDRPSDGSLDTTEEWGQVTRTVPSLAPGVDPEPGTRVGEYVIERKIGRGGMASVFAAVHPVIGKRAAIKVIAWELSRDASFVARFVREARAVNRIRHPNIVEAFSIGQLEDGRCCYAMEWLDGMSLHDRLQRGPMELAEVVAVVDQVVDALEAVHAAGIVHRDLTPRNLFLVDLRGRWTVKVLDFGVAKVVGLESGSGGLETESGVLLGTPSYASPEQAAGRPVDARADIYGLGAIAYQLLTGRPPVTDGSPTAILARKAVEAAPPVASLRPDLPPELARVVDAMVAIDPATRPSLAVIRGALARSREAAPPRRRPGRRGVIALLAGLAVGAVAIVAIRALASRPPAKQPAKQPVATPQTDAGRPPPPPPVAPPPDAGPPPAAAVEDQRGQIVITVDADDARILLDGALVGAAVRRVQVPVDAPAAHLLEVTAPGREPYQRRVQVAAGAVASIDVELLPTRGRPAAARRERARERGKPTDRPPPPPDTTGEDPDYLLQPKKLPD